MSQVTLAAPSKGLKLLSSIPSTGRSSWICRGCAIETVYRSARQFSTTRINPSKVGDLTAHNRLRDDKMPLRPSMKSRIKDAGSKEVGTDLGRIPMSLIVTSATKLPAWLSSGFLKRLRINWTRLRFSVSDFWGIFYYIWWDAKVDPLTGRKHRNSMELSTRAAIAQKLHYQFNTALARGDTGTLQKIACHGLLAKCKTRIDRRRAMKQPTESWELVDYSGLNYPRQLQKWPVSMFLINPSLRVISDKILPVGLADSYIRQCTVRIKSLQKYELVNQHADIRKLTEYVVIQKLTFKGEEGPWLMWGTVDPSTLEEVEEAIDAAKSNASTTISDRLKDRMSAMSGM